MATLSLICLIAITSFQWANNKRPGCSRGVYSWWIPTTKDLVPGARLLLKEGKSVYERWS